MNWKKCLAVLINVAFLALPYNIIGCAGGDEDPYDYFVSFYNQRLSEVKDFEPFYYTDIHFLYRESEPVKTEDVVSKEWVSYGNNSFSEKDAYDFVCKYARKDLSNLYYHIEKSQPLQVPDSVASNGMAKFFVNSKDLEALGYLMYAKQVEPNVQGDWSAWEPIVRDTAKMGKLMKNGQQLYAVAKNNSIKLRLAYQVLRLAHYSQRYAACVQLYDELVKPNSAPGILQDFCVGLKAGAMMHMHKKEEAAYLFSQLFSKSPVKRVSNYMSFDWCVQRFDEGNRQLCLAYCKSNEERANLLGLFLLGSDKAELPALKKIAQYAPQSSMLEILTLREMNKLEQHFFTPSLQFAQGKKEASIAYNTVVSTDADYLKWKEEAHAFSAFCKQVADQKSVTNKGFYSLAAAHASLIAGDYVNARKQLDQTKKLNLNDKLKDQWAMSNLLLTINSKDVLDAKFEDELVPSLQWLEKKAAGDEEYGKFYRRIFADILSPRYKKAGDKVKEVFCIGVADHANKQYVKGWGYWGMNAIQNIRYELTAEQAEALVKVWEAKKRSEFENYLVRNSEFTRDDLYDVIGTSWLRQFNFATAATWFAKVQDDYYKSEMYKTYLAANPFADLILDTHAPTDQDKEVYTKLSFSKKMAKLEQDANILTDPERKAKACYELAKGLYHMSYWGNSWLLVHYDWSGNDGLHGPNGDNPGDKEYFGVYKAESYYMKAFNATQDKNFKARSLFMASKCKQKQVSVPQYSNYKDYKDYEKAEKVYGEALKKNVYFGQLTKEFSTTPFYKEAYNTCSYLQDFVKKK